jgi:5-methylcytosine-specific restriction endonuclease McrA
VPQESVVTEFYTADGIRETLVKRYEPVLNTARQFLVKQRCSKSGGSASDIRKKSLLEAEADCPQCGLRFVGKNHNTEHIHPKSLGGGKGDSGNRIQMCRMCNNARGSIMTAFIGTPPFAKHYPEDWSKIEAFLLWSELTIDDGLDAGAQIPEVHELFMEARFAGAKPVGAKPSRAFGRFSTWSVGDGPNYPHNVKREAANVAQVQPQQGVEHTKSQVAPIVSPRTTPTVGSLLARMARKALDRLFDYEPKTVVNSTADTADFDNSSSLAPAPEDHIDKEALHAKWKAFVDLQIWSNTGEMLLGDFWDLVADEKTAHGTGWKAFERALDLPHKMGMPGKASILLQQMGYVFSFQKTEEDGYKILFSTEEE